MEPNSKADDTLKLISEFLAKTCSTFKQLVTAYCDWIENTEKEDDQKFLEDVKVAIKQFFETYTHNFLAHMTESIILILENWEDIKEKLVYNIISKFSNLYGSNKVELQKNMKILIVNLIKLKSNFNEKDIWLFFDRILTLCSSFEKWILKPAFPKIESNYKIAIGELTAIMEKSAKPKQISDILHAKKLKKNKKFDKIKEVAVKKATAPYFLYANERRSILIKENPHLSVWDIAKLIGKEWKEKLTDKDRASYVEKYKAEKEIILKQIYDSYKVSSEATKDTITIV